MKSISYGLVLSGGGVRGIAHIGVIKALEEHGIFPSYIAGASVGAIIGAFYAAGHTCEEILGFFQHTSMFSIDKYTLRKPGILDTDRFYKIFKKYFPEDRYEALEKSLYVSATDIIAGKNKIFHKGPLIYSVLASAAFPVVLSPIKIDGVLYADGGITNNFPVEPLIGSCDKLIGVFSNPLRKIKQHDLSTSMAIMDRAIAIGMDSMSTRKFSNCDLVICPEELNKLGTFSMNSLEKAYNIGYETARELLKDFSLGTI